MFLVSVVNNMFEYMPENDEFLIVDALRFYVENAYASAADDMRARELINRIYTDTWMGFTLTDPKDVK